MSKTHKKIKIIGAGLAGCEAAVSAAKFGVPVELFDAKPDEKSAVHRLDTFSELVCSNSLKSDDINTAHGLLKAEMRMFLSLTLLCADRVRVPAGGALAVDRDGFSKAVTDEILSNKNIRVINKTVNSIDDVKDENSIIIVASGPLALGGLQVSLEKLFGEKSLHFYDAAAPIISGGSIDFSSAFVLDRYAKGTGDYINCPLNKEEYYSFVKELVLAERAELKDFEKREIFDGCMPVEVMASRGADTLRFGPLKPVGLIDPYTKSRPFAVVQLRKENMAGDAYNIVGFQTNLKFNEQKRVFGMIPALKKAEFFRYGVMHRNSFINAPLILDAHYRVKNSNSLYVAGQLSGVEGYTESAASGLISGLAAAFEVMDRILPPLPDETLLGALEKYILSPNANFQPMNANFGLLPPLPLRSKEDRKAAYSSRSLEALKKYVNGIGLLN